MSVNELLPLAKRIHGYMQQLMDDEELSHWNIADEIGGEDELQMALLATAIAEGLIEGSAALVPIFQEIEEKLAELVEA